MAHCLVDFDLICDQICEQTSGSSEKDAALVLTEVFSDGHSFSRPVNQDLLESYIENDFKDGPTAHNTSTSSKSALKLIHSIRRDRRNDGRLLPLTVDSTTLKRLAKWIRMPLVFPHVLETGTATFLETSPSVPGIAVQRSGQANEDNISFILQSVPGGEWSSCFAASFTYDFASRCMYVFLHTYKTEEGPSFSEDVNIRRFGKQDQSPFLIPSAMVKAHLETRVRSLESQREEIFQLEHGMGVRQDFPNKVNLHQLDYDYLTRQINKLNQDLAWTTHSCRRIGRLLDFMDCIATRYEEQANLAGVSSVEFLGVERQLRNSHAYLRSWNLGILDRVEYLSKRLQALSQSVYSGIAQRDSTNSIRIAETSTDLAKTSQQLAIATSRDSAVMRVITAVTVVFLPGTFTATFFSTTFFNFGDGIDGRVYSKWLWLYFVVTVALTAAVIGGTWVLWRSKEKEIMRQSEEVAGASETEKLKGA